MNFYTNYLNKSKYAFLLVLIIFSSSSLYSQFTDLLDSPEVLGLKKSPNTNKVTKSVYDDNNNIYAGVWGSGVYKTTDAGNTWKTVNTGLTNLYITDIIYNRSGHLFVSTMGGGIFRSTNKGVAWTPIGTGLLHPNVKTLGMYPNGWLFAGTYGGGMYISKDDGNKWTQINNGLRYRDINSLAFANAGNIVAATNGGGIYTSRDTGKTWMQQNTGVKNKYINDLVKNNTGSIFAASNGRGVLQSANDGISWAELDTFLIRPETINKTPLPDLNITRVAVNKNNQIVYGSRYGGVFMYDDVEDFTWVTTNIRATGINELLTDKSLNIYAFPSDKSVKFSSGTGEVWTDKAIIKEPLSPQLFILGKNKSLLYIDSGKYSTSINDGETWYSDGTLNQKLTSFAIDSSGNIFAATRRGLYFSDPLAKYWSFVRFKDTAIFDVEVAPDKKIWITTQYVKFDTTADPDTPKYIYRNLFMSPDNGLTWIDKTMDLSKTLNSPYQMVITGNNIIYIVVFNQFYYTSDNGNSWKTTTDSLKNGGYIKDVFLGTNNSIFFSANDGLYKITSNTKFSKIQLYITNNQLIHVDKFNNIYATGYYDLPNGFSQVLITYRSTDGGSTFKVLSNSYNAENVTTITSNSDGDVYMTTESGSLYKIVNPATLKAPVLKILADKTEDVPNQQVFNWESVPKSELYQIQFSTDDQFIYDFETITLSDTLYQVYSNFSPYTKYWWRVRAKNHASLSDWSETRTFISKLATPNLVAPDSNAVGVAVAARLIWKKVAGAANYDILVSKSINFTDTVMFAKDYSDTVKIMNILDGLTTYYWKVIAKNSKSTSYWSNVWLFKTTVGPPRLISPANTALGLMTSLNFNWNKAIQATSYYIQISAKDDFSEIIKETSVNDTTFQYSGLEYDRVNYWRVRSENKDGASAYSDIWSFRTGYSPVLLDSPINAKVNLKIPLTLKWFKHESQNIYEVQLAQDSLFTKDLQKFENLDNILETTPANLKNYTDYYWKVRVISSDNLGLWSEIRTFRTILGKSGLRMPTDQSKGLPTSISFLWFSLQGADRYNLQISNDSNFQDLVFSQDTIVNNSMPKKDLKPQSTFYWRVRGINSDGFGEWSDVWTFTTSGNAPALLSPDNGFENVKIPVTFKWEFFTNSLNYRLQIYKDDKFETTAGGSDAVSNTEFTMNSGLEYNTVYYWRVQANLNDGSTSDWSQTWSFTTEDGTPVEENNLIYESGSYPNPFKDYTTITFNVEKYSEVSIKIIDMSGKTITSEDLGSLIPGSHKYVWNPKGLSKGAYYYIIKIGKKTIQGEMIIE